MLLLSTWALSPSSSLVSFIGWSDCVWATTVCNEMQSINFSQIIKLKTIDRCDVVRRQWHWCIIWFPKFNHHRRLIPLRHATHLANAILIFLYSPPVRWCHLGFLSVSIRIKILCHTSSEHIGMPFYAACVCVLYTFICLFVYSLTFTTNSNFKGKNFGICSAACTAVHRQHWQMPKWIHSGARMVCTTILYFIYKSFTDSPRPLPSLHRRYTVLMFEFVSAVHCKCVLDVRVVLCIIQNSCFRRWNKNEIKKKRTNQRTQTNTTDTHTHNEPFFFRWFFVGVAHYWMANMVFRSTTECNSIA